VMTVSELKKELKSRGLKVGGKKADLKARLSEALTVDSTSPTDAEQTDFADFENYINDEYNKINAQNDGDDDAHAVTIDDIINKETAAETETAAVDVEDEEKQTVYAADFDLNAPSEATATNDGAEAETETVTAPDFAEEDSAALNSRSKVQSRHERFGNAPIDEAAKVESRKRRFAAMAAENGADTTGEGGANKKARVEVDPAVERQRILERSQKFGTKLPTDFKLTSEEAALVHSEQIKRAERFGTQHLLPKEIKRAEFDAKRAERMKRFQTGEGTEAESADKAPAKASNKIIAASPDKDSTKMAERRLRFGTTAAVVTTKEPQQQQNNGKGKKLGGNRKERNAKKFEQFRQYKKNNRNGGGRGGGRGNGRIRSRGGGGGRNRSRSNGRGGNNNNRRNNNRNGNGNGNGNANRQQQKQQSQVQFNAADRAKMEERKLRFSGGQ